MHSVVSLVFVPLSENFFAIGPERSYDKAAFFSYERIHTAPRACFICMTYFQPSSVLIEGNCQPDLRVPMLVSIK